MNIISKKQKIKNINKIKNSITKNYFKNYLLSKFQSIIKIKNLCYINWNKSFLYLYIFFF